MFVCFILFVMLFNDTFGVSFNHCVFLVQQIGVNWQMFVSLLMNYLLLLNYFRYNIRSLFEFKLSYKFKICLNHYALDARILIHYTHCRIERIHIVIFHKKTLNILSVSTNFIIALNVISVFIHPQTYQYFKLSDTEHLCNDNFIC